ncbi:hypothetical protein AC579_10546 [Pseudocercospora musae]|uniref:Uncharacterized protein n=1 Tax=Pseudocercospora musae TaxID=113226 RepID=A0A139IH86_9PEZI|nr:hypothetical protein AC579_10546 [Pseudocercospora musae]
METGTAKRKASANACREADQTREEDSMVVFASELMKSVQAARLKVHPGLLKNCSGRRMTLARHQHMYREAQRMKAVEAARSDQEKRTTELKLAQFAEQFEKQKQVQKIKATYLARMRQKTFRFMDMPREMRDSVYESLATDAIVAETQTIQVSIERGPRLSLLLVSRQFRKEYTESIKRSAKLVVLDRGKVDVPLQLKPQATVRLCQAAKLTATASFRLLAICLSPDIDHNRGCTLSNDLKRHASWIRTLAPQSSHLKQIHISMLLCLLVKAEAKVKSVQWPASFINHTVKLSLESLVERAGQPSLAVDVGVVASENRGKEWDWQRDVRHAKPYGSWTQEEGWKAGVPNEESEGNA